MPRLDAPRPARVVAEQRSFAPGVAWWGHMMNEGDAKEVAVQVERIRASAEGAHTKISAHERECERRYQHIEKALEKGDDRFDDLDDKLDVMFKEQNHKLDALVARHSQDQWSMVWKAWAVAGSVIALLIAGLSWTGAELYHRISVPVAAAVVKR